VKNAVLVHGEGERLVDRDRPFTRRRRRVGSLIKMESSLSKSVRFVSLRVATMFSCMTGLDRDSALRLATASQNRDEIN